MKIKKKYNHQSEWAKTNFNIPVTALQLQRFVKASANPINIVRPMNYFIKFTINNFFRKKVFINSYQVNLVIFFPSIM